ncbi:MAG: MotA/TolQ/ExbB proton channel family protein [Paludibacter sp.]|jgi:biopolymer transport protein ExbB|nr:MotA/TolQ/ExbB proton channel family protein [Paludibacter sp.]
MMLSLILQATPVADTLSSAVNSIPVVPKAAAVSLWDIIQKGGIIMIPIGILFATAIYIFIERFISIRNASASEGNFMVEVQSLIEADKIEKALALCAKTSLPIARMVEKGIKRIGRPIKEIEESIEIVGKFEVYELERGLPILAVIAGIAPMFGFLGTILGVIKIFFDISQTSDVSIGAVSAGLYVKMVSSASGLLVGILAYIFYNWLNIKVAKAVNKMERNAMNFIDFLQEPNK